MLFAFGTFTACSKSIDGGITFVRTGTPPYTDDPTQEGGSQGVQGHCGGAVGHGAVGPDGTVYLPRGWCGKPYVAISEDEGATWEKVQVAGNGMAVGPGQEEHEMNVAVDADGTVYTTWIAQDRLPYLAVSRDRVSAAPASSQIISSCESTSSWLRCRFSNAICTLAENTSISLRSTSPMRGVAPT
jgi:hypothetical protein